MIKENKIALAVISCDAYADLWDMFIFHFRKYWPDCPFDKFFITNKREIQDPDYQTIKTGEDISWSDNLIIALKILRKKYSHVFFILEDLPLVEKVDNSAFLAMLNEFYRIDGNYLKFIRKPKPTHALNPYFGKISEGSLYRPTCVYALWKIDVCLSLLKSGENAWEFERYGALRSDNTNGFYVVYKDFFKVVNTVVKGKWVPSVLRKINKLGYSGKPGRPLLSPREAIMQKIRSYFFKIFVSVIPWRYRRTIVFSLKKL